MMPVFVTGALMWAVSHGPARTGASRPLCLHGARKEHTD